MAKVVELRPRGPHAEELHYEEWCDLLAACAEDMASAAKRRDPHYQIDQYVTEAAELMRGIRRTADHPFWGAVKQR